MIFNREMIIYLSVVSLSWLQFPTVPIHILPYSIRDVSESLEHPEQLVEAVAVFWTVFLIQS